MLSYTVGAIFELVDEASPTLLRLSERFTELDELVTSLKANMDTLGAGAFAGFEGSLDTITEAMTALDAKSATFGETLTTTATEAGAAFVRAAEEVDAIAAAYGKATEAAQAFTEAALAGSAAVRREEAAAAAGGFGGFRGSEGPGGGPGGMGGKLGPAERDAEIAAGGAAAARGGGGGGHGLLTGMGPIAEVLAGYGGNKAAMEEDMALRQTLVGLGIDPASPEGIADYNRMRAMIADTTEGTIFSRTTASKALPGAGPVLGFSGQEAIGKIEQVFPVALRAGELSAMRHKGNLNEEAVAGEEFAHLTDEYNPVGIEKRLDLVNAIAQRANTSIERQQSIMKYGLPTSQMAGIDPDRAIMDMGQAEQNLGPTSTVGTGYSQAIMSAFSGGGSLHSHLDHSQKKALAKTKHDFEEALKLEDPNNAKDFAEHSKGTKHEQALAAFGLTPKVVADALKNKNIDVVLKEHVRAYAESHTDTLEELNNLAGTRGMKYMAQWIAPDSRERQARYEESVHSAKSVREQQEELSQAPLQQFEQMLSNVSNIGNTLATATLPVLNEAFKAINYTLLGIEHLIDNNPALAKVGGVALDAGMAVGLGLGSKKLLGAAWRTVFGGGGKAGAAAADALAGAGEGAVGDLFGGAGLLGPLGVPLALTAVGAGAAAAGSYMSGKDIADHAKDNQTPLFIDEQGHAIGYRDVAPPRAGPRANAAPPTQVHAPVTVNLGPVTMQGMGADEKSFTAILDRLANALRHSLAFSNGSGQGSDASPYVFGGS